MSSPLPKLVAVNVAWKMELLFNGTIWFFFSIKKKFAKLDSISLCHSQGYMCEKYNYLKNSDEV